MLEKRFERNVGVWDAAFQNKLRNITIGVAGLGGAGCCLVDILARNGVGHIKVADPEAYDESNFQRQVFATEYSLGRNKAFVAKQHVLSINPNIELKIYEQGVNQTNVDDFLDGCDFIHEVIDHQNITDKVILHRHAREKGIVVTTTALIGTGASLLVFMPGSISFEQYFHFHERSSKQRQSHQDIVRFDPDYLDLAFFLSRVEKGCIPTTADGAYLCGILAAGIYKRLLMGKHVACAPQIVRLDILDDNLYQRALFE